MIKLGLIGCGEWGRRLLRCLLATENAEVEWISDIDEEKMMSINEDIGTATFVKNFTTALDEVEAVVVATPTATHYEIARQALEADKDVLIEKPMTMHAIGAEDLCKLAEEKAKILMVDHTFIYHPAATKIFHIVKAGIIGTVRRIHSERLRGIIREEEDVLWSLAPHDISMILEIMGDDYLIFEAWGKSCLPKSNGKIDIAITTMEYADKATATIYVSWMDYQRVRRLTVIGEEAEIVFDFKDAKWRLDLIYKDTAFNLKLDKTEPLQAMCDHYVHCLETRETPKTDGRDGLKVIEALETIETRLKRSRNEL